ncbi:MAG TPA: RNA-binding cell elongation regulator Jag/EloR [Halanaerobiales bacterium]|nr:RNA-binding cell elongation regulator Jag/EloR [Halanaerobiales bacterium]
MLSLKQEGKTVDEAISLALEKLNMDKDEVDIRVIKEGNKGILGIIGGKKALIEVKAKADPIKEGRDFLKKVFEKMSIRVSVEIIARETNNEQVLYNINSRDLGIIIGHRGETLDALQYLTSLVVNKKTIGYFRVLIDAEGYREKRRKTIERLARKLARKALSTGRKVMLEPMPPHERRIIHITLKEDERVYTYSEGKEPYRRVMIVKQEDKDENIDRNEKNEDN